MGMNTAAVQRLYVAYFNRPADPVSLAVYEAMLPTDSVATQAELQVIAETYFSPSAEYTTNFAGKSNAQIVDQLYQNIFGRTAEADGLVSWASKLTDGSMTVAELALQLSYSAQGTDADVVDARIEAATAFTNALDTSAEITGYSGNEAAASGKVYLAQITGNLPTTTADITAQKDAAVAGVDASVTSAISAGSTAAGITTALTTSTDNVTGGAGDDTVNASSATFNSDDIIDLGDGSDTFSVTANAAGTTIANLSNTELVKVTQGGATNTDYALNMIAATGVENVMSRLSTGEVSFDNLQNLVGVHAYGTQGGAKVTASFLNSLASGTAADDSVSLIIDGGANATFQVSGTTDTNEFETINLSSNGALANTVSIKDAGGNDPAALATYNVSGAAKLTQTLAGGASKATFDASTATGAQVVTWGGNYTTLKTGSAADTIVAAGSFFGSTNPKTVDGGDGEDTLAISESVSNLTSNTTDVLHSVTNVETLEIDAKLADGSTDDLAVTVEADLFSVDSVKIDASNLDTAAGGDGGEDVTVTVNDLGSQTVTMAFVASSTATNDEIISLNLKDDSGSADVINLATANPSSTTVTSISSLTVGRSAASTANAVETVNIALGASDTTTTNYGTTINALDAQYSSTLVLTGAGGLELDSVELADPAGTTTAVIDASGMSGKLKLDTGFKTTASDTVTITLGSGTNTVDFAAEGLDADSVIGTTGAKDTVSLLEAAADTEMTITNIDTVKLTGAGASKKISAKKMTDVGVIAIYDAGNGDSTTDDVSLEEIAAGQAIEIHSTANSEDWDGGTVTLDLATGVTEASIAIKGDTALEGTGVISSDIVTMNLAVDNKTSSGVYFDQTVVLSNTATTAVLTTLNITGGGAVSTTANSTTTITATNNVNIATLDATGYTGNLDISGATTKAGGSVTLGSGANKVTVALADLALDTLTIDGGDGSDTLIAADLAATLYRPTLLNIEKLDLDLYTDTATELSLADSSGVETIELDLDSTNQNFTVSSATSVTAYKLEDAAVATADIITLGSGATLTVSNVNAVLGDANTSLVLPNAADLTVKVGKSTGGVATAAIDLTTLTTASATSITMGGNDIDVATAAEYIGKIDINTLVAAKLTDLTLDLDQGDIDLDTVTAAKLTNVTVTGDNGLVFGATGATTTALASFDASAATGTIAIGQAVDFASSASVKTGTADDTLTLDVLTEGGVAVDMGEKSSDDDTLSVSGANNMGLSVVDLSAADQITQMNGAINGAVQTGIESIDFSGLSGSFGVTVTGSGDANTITGTANADNIIAGGGADVVNAGGGNDTIDLTESTEKVDTVTAAAAYSSVDTITGWNDSDKLDVTTATAQGSKTQTDLDTAVAIGGVAEAGKSIVVDGDGLMTVIDETVATDVDDTVIIARTAELSTLATQVLAEITNTAVVLQFDSTNDGVADSTFLIAEHAGGAEYAIFSGILLTGVAAADNATELYLI